MAEGERACDQCGLVSGRSAGLPLGFTDGKESLLGGVRSRWVGARGYGWGGGEEFEPQWAVYGVRPVRPTFNHGIFDLAGEHDDDMDILLPNETRAKSSQC